MFKFWKIFDALINDVDGSKIHDNSISNEKIISIDGHKLMDRSVPHTKLIEGEGSGLNADLLDGIHGSQVVRNDVASKIYVNSKWCPLVIAGTPDPNNTSSLGLAIFPDDDESKHIEYSSKRNGDFRIWQANEKRDVLEKSGSDLLFMGKKVWNDGDFSKLIEASESNITFPNGLQIWSLSDRYFLDNYYAHISVKGYLKSLLIIASITGCEYPAYITSVNNSDCSFDVLVKANSPSESVVIQYLVFGF